MTPNWGNKQTVLVEKKGVGQGGVGKGLRIIPRVVIVK